LILEWCVKWVKKIKRPWDAVDRVKLCSGDKEGGNAKLGGINLSLRVKWAFRSAWEVFEAQVKIQYDLCI